MKTTLLSLAMLLALSACAQQNCDCSSSLQWMQETFETNDAGFAYGIDVKGQQAYDLHTASIRERAAQVKDDAACAELLNEWLLFFRSGHIGLQYNGSGATASSESEGKESKEAIRAKFADWEKMDFNVEEFKAYLDTKEVVDFEGIWESGVYQIGIKKVKDTYLGFIIEADGVYWMPGQIKLRIKPSKAVYYMQDHSAETFDKAELIGDTYLVMGFIDLNRTYPEIQADPALARYIKNMSAEKPFFEQLDKETAYLRIPSFGRESKKFIDKMIKKNQQAIKDSENLIIDIRGNGGGSDVSYDELLPFMYTQPIRTVGVEFYSTPKNNQRMLDFINNPEFEFTDEEKVWAQTAYDKLAAREGEFVNLDSTVVDIFELEEVLPKPSKVAIMINGDNG
ncbi:MAG: S41 family peptidase, partial [Bacteroidota bacterium]